MKASTPTLAQDMAGLSTLPGNELGVQLGFRLKVFESCAGVV